jgi:hypothetical protein
VGSISFHFFHLNNIAQPRAELSNDEEITEECEDGVIG